VSETNPIPKRIAVKFFADPSAEVHLEPFIELFHRFIQEQAVLGLLVDVADYAHVPNGPGVILIGHDVDYSIDATGGRTGLLTTRKNYDEKSETLVDVLRDAVAKAVVAVRAIEEDGSAALDFDTGRVEVQILDRLVTRQQGALERLLDEMTPIFSELFGKVEVAIAAGDARRPPTVGVVADEAAGVATLCDRLGVTMPVPERDSAFEISPQRLKELRDAKADFVLIDVREHAEYETCNLGGELVPLAFLSKRILELDKRVHVVVHCKGGSRGARATAALREAGFENAWNLKGGILAWIDEVDASLTKY
jgi:rhodanese-related sulfurtransferase